MEYRISELEENNRALRALLESTMRELQAFKDSYQSERSETLAEVHALREKVLLQSVANEPPRYSAPESVQCFDPLVVERCLDLNIE